MEVMQHSTPTRPMVKRNLLADFPEVSPMRGDETPLKSSPPACNSPPAFHRPWLDNHSPTSSNQPSPTSSTSSISSSHGVSPAPTTTHMPSQSKRCIPATTGLTPYAQQLKLSSTKPASPMDTSRHSGYNVTKAMTSQWIQSQIPTTAHTMNTHRLAMDTRVPTISCCTVGRSSTNNEYSPNSSSSSVASFDVDVSQTSSPNCSPVQSISAQIPSIQKMETAPNMVPVMSQLSSRIASFNTKLFAYLCTLPQGPARVYIQKLYSQYQTSSVALEAQRMHALKSGRVYPMMVQVNFDNAHNRLLDITEKSLEAAISMLLRNAPAKQQAKPAQRKPVHASFPAASQAPQEPARVQAPQPIVIQPVQFNGPQQNPATLKPKAKVIPPTVVPSEQPIRAQHSFAQFAKLIAPRDVRKATPKLKTVSGGSSPKVSRSQIIANVKTQPMSSASGMYVSTHAQQVMEQWFLRNLDNPYPSREHAQELAISAGLSVQQLRRWFTNRRNLLSRQQKSSLYVR